MGACACAGEQKHVQVNDLIRIQSIYRSHLAKKELKQLRENKLKQLFSKGLDYNNQIGSNRARRDSFTATGGECLEQRPFIMTE